MRPLGGWQTKGLWKGHLGIKGTIDYLDYMISEWWKKGNEYKRPIQPTPQKIQTIESVKQISFGSTVNKLVGTQKKKAKKIGRQIKKGYNNFLIFLDAVWHFPWLKLLKLIVIVVGVPLIIVFIYTSVQYTLHKQELVKEEMDALHNKQMEMINAQQVVIEAKLDELKNSMFELEEQMAMYKFHIPVYYRPQRKVTAIIMNGKKKGTTTVLE